MKNAYLPLYRKYRPQKIEDVVGQSHIKTALKNAIELNKISHAYLFTGPRGTGKTSTARILAKSLNCINGPTLTPCDECESCKSVINSVPIDVIEMDAASNRSVEDAQNILEKVQYAPTFGKYKIYIIDEIHMLSNHAFNALLKTLEEPPANVVFIFATTEAHKVPDTIKSRCQRFDFKRITTDDIIEHLVKIAENEKIKIAKPALKLIAQNSSGCMRDSLALLDQVSILGLNKEIVEDDINNMLGRISFDILYKLADSIINSHHADAMSVLDEIYHNGNEPVQILTNLLGYFKNLLVAKSCDLSKIPELTGLTEEQNNLLINQTNSLELHQITFLINKCADYIKDIKMTSNQHLWLDVAIIDLANLADNTKLQDLQNRLLALESGATASNISSVRQIDGLVQPQKILKQVQNDNMSQTQVNNTNSEVKTLPQKHDASNIIESWTKILKGINSQPAQALFNVANPVKIDSDGIVITFKAPSFVEKANMPEKKDYLVQSVSALFGNKNIPITIRTPMADDVKQEKVNLNPVKKTNQLPPPPPDIDFADEIQNIEAEDKLTESKNLDIAENSDQAKMVKDLFDGKYIE